MKRHDATSESDAREPVTGRLRVEVLQLVPDPSAPSGVAGARADLRVGNTVWRNAPVGALPRDGGGRVIVCFMTAGDFDAEASGNWGEPGTAPPKRPAGQAALWNRVQRAVAEAYRRAEAEGRINTGYSSGSSPAEGFPSSGGRAEA